MGLFNWKKKKDPTNVKPAKTQNNVQPILFNGGRWTKIRNIDSSDTVSQVINRIANEVAKCKPVHERIKGSITEKITDSDIYRLLQKPNKYMTKTPFLYKVTATLLMKENAFIYPEYTLEVQGLNVVKKYTALYPLSPNRVEIYEDEVGNALYLKMYWNNGYTCYFPYEDIIHLRKDYQLNEFFGGDENGDPNYKAIIKTVQLNETLLEGVEKGLKTSFTINGILQYDMLYSDDEMKVAIKEFNDRILNSESAVVPLDAKGQYINIPRDIKIVDKDTLEYTEKKVLRHWGTPIEILDGKYDQATRDSWYSTAIIPILDVLLEEFTYKLFTQQQINGGNRIAFSPDMERTMSNSEIIQTVTLLLNIGGLSIDEARERLGFPAIGLNERPKSLNWVNAEIADAYQLGIYSKENMNKVKEEIQEDKPQEPNEENQDEEIVKKELN